MDLRCIEKDVFTIIFVNFLNLGSHLYVSAEGQLEVVQDSRYLGTLGPGKAFGELALLYNCKRTATVRGILE